MAEGNELEGFAAGTAWPDIPADWTCPDCGVRDKVDFVPLSHAGGLTMRIIADRDTCDGHGMCEAMAHEFFELDDDGLVHVLDEAPAEQHHDLVDAAVRSCPVSALRVDR